MYKPIIRFKKNTQKSFEKNIKQISIENSKKGKNKKNTYNS